MMPFSDDLLRCFSPQAKVIYLPTVASTNDTAHNLSFRHGDLILAEQQEAGRGQQGNSWVSEPGRNLTFSLVLEPRFLPADRQFQLLEAVSLGVTDALAEFDIKPSIKWPNDILIDGRKVAGILIEHDLRGMELVRSIVGIGLNVNQEVFPVEIPAPISMAQAAGRMFDRAEALGVLCRCICDRYRSLEQGETDRLNTDYHARLYRLNEPAHYRTPEEGFFTGIIRHVGSFGELYVERPGGEVKSYLFKEIEFLPEGK